jgi:hypothetical protein
VTDFVGLSPTDVVGARDNYRIVVERHNLSVGGLEHLHFAPAVTDFYNSMFGKTGVAYPVSPNPVVYGSASIVEGEQSAYAIDIRIGDAVTGITAADLVNRLNAIISGFVYVTRFQAIAVDDVADANARDDLAAQAVANSSTDILGNLSHLATLAVIALLALAAIQISKDL